MSQTDKLPVLQAIKSSWKFAAASWMPTLPAYLAKSLIFGLFFSSVMINPETSGFIGMVGLFVILFAEIACATMTLRLAVRAEYEGFLGIQIGADEGRLFVAQLLYVFLLWLVILISGFVVFSIAGAFLSTTIPDIAAVQNDEEAFLKAVVQAFQSPVGIAMASVLALVFLFPIIFLAARLITFPSAIIARKKIMIFDTWAWTKGYAFQIMVALIVSLAPFFIIYQLGQYAASIALGMESGLFTTGADLQATTKFQSFIIGFLAGILSMPMNLVSSGLSAFMYNGFNPDR